MVTEGSVERTSGTLEVRFVVTDYRHSVPVHYEGLLPDLFREGQGVIAHGRMDAAGEFVADEVLAKHDENYMPPEVAESLHSRRRRGYPNDPGTRPFRADPRAAPVDRAGRVRTRRRGARAMRAWLAAARSAVVGQFVFVALAFGALTWAFVQRDFSVLYVATNSHSRAAALLPRRRRLGRARGLLAAVVAVPRGLDACRGGGEPLAGGAVSRPRARRARAHQHRLPAVHAGDLESVRAAGAGGARRTATSTRCCRISRSRCIRRSSTSATSASRSPSHSRARR